MAKALLDIRNLKVSHTGTTILHGVSVALYPGQVVGIVGESGSGKSTVLRAAMNALGREWSVDGGSVTYRGSSLLEADEAALHELRGGRISMVFQDPRMAFCPVRTVGAQFAETLAAHGHTDAAAARKMALRCLAAMGLEEGERVLGSYAHELSGGMCQRASLALATCLGPDVLLADEPTSALDVMVQAQVVDELERLRAHESMAILIVSHDLRIMARLADYLYVMQTGKVVEQGSCEQVLTSPQHPYTASLIAAVPRFTHDGEVRHG